MNKTTLGQQRASYCLEMLKNMTCNRTEFKPLSAGLPSMILQNGFGQTLAFLAAKGSEVDKKTKVIIFKNNDKHMAAFQIISSWLVTRQLLKSDDPPLGILNQISKMHQAQYLHAQRETLAMLEWLKRYANAALFEG